MSLSTSSYRTNNNKSLRYNSLLSTCWICALSLLMVASSPCLGFALQTWNRRQLQQASQSLPQASFVLSHYRSTQANISKKDSATLLQATESSGNGEPEYSSATEKEQTTSSAENDPEVVEAAAGEEPVETSSEEEDQQAQPPPPPEDPELKALKDEIAGLESTLKEKRRSLASMQDVADDYTKTGYARKVAEMENMRRARRMLASSNKAGSIASTIAEFLPIYDRLEELNNLYASDDFGRQYNALLSSLKQAMTDLGVVEYSAEAGQEVDTFRMMVLESQYNEQQPANTVLQTMRPGMELEGNVIRAAEVIASLGSETATATTPEEDATVAGEEASEEPGAEGDGASDEEPKAD